MPLKVSQDERCDMDQLTVRGISDELADSIRRLAKSESISLNQAALRFLRKGAGFEKDSGNENAIGASLDDLFGTWSYVEAEEFNASLDVFEKVDESAGSV